MQSNVDVERFLDATEEAFAVHLYATHAVSEPFYDAMRPTIAAAFRDLPRSQRLLILTTTERAFARQAATEALIASASRGRAHLRELGRKASLEQKSSRRSRKIWVPHIEFSSAFAAERKVV